MQTSTGIRELKTHLSHYLRRVQAGEIIIITDRGRPIGQLVPYHQTVEERLAQLQASGLIEWSGEHPDTAAPVAEAQGERTVAELLLEDRD
jgi:prevent-host-death family protein